MLPKAMLMKGLRRNDVAMEIYRWYYHNLIRAIRVIRFNSCNKTLLLCHKKLIAI
jgi:hypothetical protein